MKKNLLLNKSAAYLKSQSYRLAGISNPDQSRSSIMKRLYGKVSRIAVEFMLATKLQFSIEKKINMSN